MAMGEAKDASGRSKVIRIVTLNGYSLTVFSSLAIVERLIANGFSPGCLDAGRDHGKGLHLEPAWNV